MKFTQTEIDLARQMKWRKPVEVGDWIVIGYDWKKLVDGVHFNGNKNGELLVGVATGDQRRFPNPYIPLPSLTDCFEWLREKGVRIELAESDKGRFECWDGYRYHEGDTPLEAVYRAIIAIEERENDST